MGSFAPTRATSTFTPQLDAPDSNCFSGREFLNRTPKVHNCLPASTRYQPQWAGRAPDIPVLDAERAAGSHWASVTSTWNGPKRHEIAAGATVRWTGSGVVVAVVAQLAIDADIVQRQVVPS